MHEVSLAIKGIKILAENEKEVVIPDKEDKGNKDKTTFRNEPHNKKARTNKDERVPNGFLRIFKRRG